jgi:hypothetical protein
LKQQTQTSCFDTSTRFPDVGFLKIFLKGNKMTTLVTTQSADQTTAAISPTVVQNDTFSLSGASVTVQDTGTVIKSSKSAAAVLNDLIAEKDAWFTNAYKTSNDQLYALLAKCYVS